MTTFKVTISPVFQQLTMMTMIIPNRAKDRKVKVVFFSSRKMIEIFSIKLIKLADKEKPRARRGSVNKKEKRKSSSIKTLAAVKNQLSSDTQKKCN